MRKPTLFGGRNTESRPEASQKMEVHESKPKDQETESKAVASNVSERRATIRYLDRADMAETFADSITGLIFDGQTLRIEFGVTRFDNVKANTPATGRRYPACRLVLPPTAAVDLINRMTQIGSALQRAGVAKSIQASTEAPKSS
jgi:hypothetical protein